MVAKEFPALARKPVEATRKVAVAQLVVYKVPGSGEPLTAMFLEQVDEHPPWYWSAAKAASPASSALYSLTVPGSQQSPLPSPLPPPGPSQPILNSWVRSITSRVLRSTFIPRARPERTCGDVRAPDFCSISPLALFRRVRRGPAFRPFRCFGSQFGSRPSAVRTISKVQAI